MAVKKKKTDAGASDAAAPVFSKEQLVTSRRYRDRRDVLTAVLDDDGQYTIEQADSLIEKFMKGKVK